VADMSKMLPIGEAQVCSAMRRRRAASHRNR
jgi:hypothetical protein